MLFLQFQQHQLGIRNLHLELRNVLRDPVLLRLQLHDPALGGGEEVLVLGDLLQLGPIRLPLLLQTCRLLRVSRLVLLHGRLPGHHRALLLLQPHGHAAHAGLLLLELGSAVAHVLLGGLQLLPGPRHGVGLRLQGVLPLSHLPFRLLQVFYSVEVHSLAPLDLVQHPVQSVTDVRLLGIQCHMHFLLLLGCIFQYLLLPSRQRLLFCVQLALQRLQLLLLLLAQQLLLFKSLCSDDDLPLSLCQPFPELPHLDLLLPQLGLAQVKRTHRLFELRLLHFQLHFAVIHRLLLVSDRQVQVQLRALAHELRLTSLEVLLPCRAGVEHFPVQRASLLLNELLQCFQRQLHLQLRLRLGADCLLAVTDVFLLHLQGILPPLQLVTQRLQLDLLLFVLQGLLVTQIKGCQALLDLALPLRQPLRHRLHFLLLVLHPLLGGFQKTLRLSQLRLLLVHLGLPLVVRARQRAVFLSALGWCLELVKQRAVQVAKIKFVARDVNVLEPLTAPAARQRLREIRRGVHRGFDALLHFLRQPPLRI
mmetsp:Transcript_47290/g.79165  ORF Transcript_47290/g.79165 Transcript_47290/m.79165 type:complete len:534 (-) Transcript_47290:244-1845(-)